MAAQPVGEAGKACSALLSFAMACLKTHSYPGRSASTLFTRPEASKVRCGGLKGSASQGNCLISRFFHMLEVRTMKECIRMRAGNHRVSHDIIQSKYFAIHNGFTTTKTTYAIFCKNTIYITILLYILLFDEGLSSKEKQQHHVIQK